MLYRVHLTMNGGQTHNLTFNTEMSICSVALEFILYLFMSAFGSMSASTLTVYIDLFDGITGLYIMFYFFNITKYI
jgi:hypothetical protein